MITEPQLRDQLPRSATPWPLDSAALLVALEDAADRAPRDQALATAVRQAHGFVTAGDGVPLVIAGVRRTTLIRWDAWTSTWEGLELTTGRPAQVRTLLAAHARDPVLRRALVRDGRAIRDAIADPAALSIDEGNCPALVLRLSGSPLQHAADPQDHAHPELVARMLGSALADLSRLEEHHLGLPALDPSEVRINSDGLRIACLTPDRPGTLGRAVAHTCAMLLQWWGEGPLTPVDAIVAGFVEFPPTSVAEAADAWRGSIAEHLAGEHHSLSLRASRLRHRLRRERLHAALVRLELAAAPPEGRAAVGVDLDGKATVLECHGRRMRWGVAGNAWIELYGSNGFDAKEARRMLRARAAAPPNPRLQSEHGGDDGFLDAACRWVFTGLQLRTMKLLLEASG